VEPATRSQPEGIRQSSAGHTRQCVATLVSQIAQIASIIPSPPFVLV
jgi:hypothetical protein